MNLQGRLSLSMFIDVRPIIQIICKQRALRALAEMVTHLAEACTSTSCKSPPMWVKYQGFRESLPCSLTHPFQPCRYLTSPFPLILCQFIRVTLLGFAFCVYLSFCHFDMLPVFLPMFLPAYQSACKQFLLKSSCCLSCHLHLGPTPLSLNCQP